MFAATFTGVDQLASLDSISTESNVADTTVVEVHPVTTEEKVKEYFKDTPILSQIAFCESRFRQFNEQGEVLRGMVNSRDVGVMQINEYYHLDKAQELGYNIYTLEGNLGYAKNLYERQGAAPWVHSSKCWSNDGGIAYNK